MSKLIKLTTTLDRNRDTNGYIAISDNDIILQPNARVSLLNAHLSSGILADYDITGTDTLGQVAQGEIVANIQLADSGDRERDIIIPNGSYSLNPLLTQFQNSMNQAFVYNSTTQYSTTTSQALNIPTTLDFGIACQSTLDVDNKVKIAFNSTQPKYTADLKYTNKNNGVNISATGDVSFTGATGAFQVTLDPAKATRDVVYTNEEIGAGIGVFDVVTLVNSVSGDSVQTTVTAIALDSTNVNNSINLDTTKTDAVAGVVVSAAAFTQTIPFQVGQDITIDDGTGVVGTPSANTAYGKIAAVELQLTNANYEIAEIATEKIQDIAPTHAIISIAPVAGLNNTYKLDINSDYALAAARHLADDALFYILDATNAKYAVCQVTAVAEHINPGALSTTDITVVVEPLDANPLEEAKMHFIQTAEFIYSTGGKTSATDTAIQGQLGWFDKDYNLIAILYIDGNPVVQNDYYVFEIELGKYECVDPQSGALLNGLPAFLQFTKLTWGSAGFDINDVSVTSVDHLITSNPTALATFALADNDNAVVFEQGLVNQSPIKVNFAPEAFIAPGGDEFVVIPFEFINNTWTAYADLFKKLLPATNEFYIVKDNVNQNLKFTLNTLTGVALSPVLTRFWIGTNVVNTFAVTLNIAPASRIRTNLFDLLCKGTNSVGQENALCIEDSRLIPSCGRLAFKIITLGVCEFGVMPEASNFNSLSRAAADIRIKIEKTSAAGSAQLVYALYRAGVPIPLKKELFAFVGDTVIIQYGVTPSNTDYEYNNNVNSATNPSGIRTNNINTIAGVSLATNYDEDRNKILISVIRNGKSDTYIHFGCALNNPNTTKPPANQPPNLELIIASCIPWTPRDNPYLPPQYWNNSRNYRMYVCPNLATIRPLELTPSPLLVTNSVTGTINHFDGTNHIYNPELHGSSNLELLDLDPNKFGAFNNQFIFTFTSATFQKILGYKTTAKAISGLSGNWVADISYLKAYLPEGICILLENLSGIDTFDCGQFNGSRRNIIATCIDTQDKLGEISVEPSNLYRINIGNTSPINLRKFALAFEDLFGNKLILQNAKVCVSLLFE
jgi:hypothetical protein